MTLDDPGPTGRELDSCLWCAGELIGSEPFCCIECEGAWEFLNAGAEEAEREMAT